MANHNHEFSPGPFYYPQELPTDSRTLPPEEILRLAGIDGNANIAQLSDGSYEIQHGDRGACVTMLRSDGTVDRVITDPYEDTPPENDSDTITLSW